MDLERSKRVIAEYRQHKLNASALAHIKRYFDEMAAEAAFGRRMFWIGVVVAIVLLALVGYFYTSLSHVTIS